MSNLKGNERIVVHGNPSITLTSINDFSEYVGENTSLKVVTLTQAQYDALPESEKLNPLKLYSIQG